MKNGCFEGIKLFLFDMDGTLYIGNRLFDFTEELLCVYKKSGEEIPFYNQQFFKKRERLCRKAAKARY